MESRDAHAHSPESADGGGLTRRRFVAGATGAAVGIAAGGVSAVPGVATAAHTRRSGAHGLGAEVPTAWFDLSLALVRSASGFSPPVASRALAYAGMTLYEAVVPGMDGYRSLGRVFRGLNGLPHARDKHYDWEVTANAALASILRSLIPTAGAAELAALADLEAEFERRLARRRSHRVLVRSKWRGREVAARIFAWSQGDGGHEGYARNFPPYTPPAGPGLWVPTPPAFSPALQPSWGANRTFALADARSPSPGDHPPYAEAPGSRFRAEAEEVYETVNSLTPEQETIARFWSDDPGETATPPGHSVSITTQVLRREGSSLAAAAEAYARVGIALSDAFVACWLQKYRYNLVRPVTYIRALIDPAWTPVLITPPFPEYPSGHSVQSGAAFQVLTNLFGKRYRFVDHTHDDRGFRARSFDSFLDAAREAAISRLYGGIHYRAAIDNGVFQGRRIGQAASALPLRRR
jgi:PAP2 superfamily